MIPGIVLLAESGDTLRELGRTSDRILEGVGFGFRFRFGVRPEVAVLRLQPP